jgi:hypothetical protein
LQVAAVEAVLELQEVEVAVLVDLEHQQDLLYQVHLQ